ncbi:DUF4262 domain-containing protein [Streptomyces coeruleorubidus]|uniref:DUF4262 domain-containing protein n=1 Tax=Streptomyces coeruleorubidus TaxID=116188 RepID=UPI0033B1ED47
MTLLDENLNPLLPRHTVTFVFDPDGVKPPFAYTVGLAERPGRAYELVTVGLPGRLSHAVVTCAAKQLVRDCLDPADGLELDEVLRGYLVRLRRAVDTTRFRGIAPTVPFWQILTPDKWGFFPGDPNYSESADAQPLL